MAVAVRVGDARAPKVLLFRQRFPLLLADRLARSSLTFLPSARTAAMAVNALLVTTSAPASF